MENILLFSVEMNPQDILSSQPNMSMDVSGYDSMTTKEVEQFNQLMGAASRIVIAAMLRGLREDCNDDYDEED